MVTSLTVTPSALACRDRDLTPGPGTLGRVKSAIVCELNRQRAHQRLPLLHRERHLDRSSQFQSADMVDHHFFAHQVKGHPSLLNRVIWSGYFADAISGWYAENLAYGPPETATARGLVAAWMDSPEHRATILDRRIRDIGVGARLSGADPAFYADHASVVYTTDFGERRRRSSRRSHCRRSRRTTAPKGSATPRLRYCRSSSARRG